MNQALTVPVNHTPTERALAVIWKEILEIPDCPIDVNYVDLGGTSVSLYLIIERINQEMNVDFDPQVFFHPEKSTLRDIAEQLDLMLERSKTVC